MLNFNESSAVMPTGYNIFTLSLLAIDIIVPVKCEQKSETWMPFSLNQVDFSYMLIKARKHLYLQSCRIL